MATPRKVLGFVMFYISQTGAILMMNVFSFAAAFAQHLRSFQLDDSSVALIALLAGMIGGYRITGWHAQLKAKRAKIAEKPRVISRKPD
ncbi:MAG: hypothetical protein ACJ8R9_11850 [Steroidobacteraceae bacterium]